MITDSTKLILEDNFTRYYSANKYNKLFRDVTINNTGKPFNCQCQGISHNPLLFTVLGSSIKTWLDKGSHQFRTPSNSCFWTSPWPWELWRKENALEQREADKLELREITSKLTMIKLKLTLVDANESLESRL